MKQYTTRRSINFWLILTALSLALVLLVTVVAMAARDDANTETGVAGLIPKTSVGFVMLDTPWFYTNLIGLKDAEGKSLIGEQKEFKELEEKLGISLERDIMSWVGRMGVAVLSIEETEIIFDDDGGVDGGVAPDAVLEEDADAGEELDIDEGDAEEMDEAIDGDMNEEFQEPRSSVDVSLAIFLEVRNRALFLAKLPGLLKNVPEEQLMIWKEDVYQGVSIRRSEMDLAGEQRTIALGELNGWLVCAIGDGTMEKIIDSAKGIAPSYMEIPGMKEAFAQLPETNCALISVNGDSDMQLTQVPTESMAGTAMLGACSVTEQGMQFETTTLAISDAMQQRLKRYKEIMKAPQGKALAHLPVGTFAVLSFSNPGALMLEMKKSMLDTPQDDMVRQMMEQTFARIQPLQDLLNNVTGEVALAGSWSKELGFGITLVGEHASTAKVKDSVKLMKNFVTTTFEIPVTDQNGLCSLPRFSEEQDFPFQPCWTTKSNTWLAISSSVAWIKKTGPAKMPLMPQDARGANAIMAADMSFLSGVFDSIEKNHPELPREQLAALRALQLEKIQLISYEKISDDAKMVRSTCQLNNLDLQKILALLLDENGPIAQARLKAQQAASTNNLRQLATSAMIFAQENEEILPTLKELQQEDVIPEQLWIQPSSGEPYRYHEALGGKGIGELANPENTVLFYEQHAGRNGMRAVAFLDGHVEMVDIERWEELVELNGLE